MSALFKLKDHFKENQLYLNRTVAVTVFVFLLLMILICRLVYLQIAQHDLYATLARNNQVRIVPMVPTRGLIYDRNGVLLAENVSTFSLEIVPSRVKNLEDTLSRLSEVIAIGDSDRVAFRKQMRYKGPFDSIPIRVKLSEEEVARFSLVKYEFPEVEVAARLSRYYPQGPHVAHALGYIGPISEGDLNKINIAQYRGTHQIGKWGVEKFYEEALHGKVGYEQVETDARGRIIRVLDKTPPVPGQNLYLNLDVRLQQLAYEAFNGRKGALVALDAQTGGVLALVSNPSYDNNLFVQGIDQKSYMNLQQDPDQPLFNRAIRGQYAPGSTVKPIIALQALEKGIINPNRKFFDPGYYQLHEEGRYFRCWKAQGHGWTNLESAIMQSCTSYFFYVADKMGIDRLNDIFLRFGLGQMTGVDLHGEAAGVAPSVQWKRDVKHAKWFPGETLNVGIGQGYTLVTPVQIAQMAAIIANRGHKVQPRLVRSVGYEQVDDPSMVKENFMSPTPVIAANPQNWKLIIHGMENVVKSPYGTAHYIHRQNGIPIAGKTGTAQVFSLKQDEKYEGDKLQEQLRDHSWFMAFAPVEEPKIAVAIILEHSKASAVIAHRIIEAYLEGKFNEQPS